MFGRYSAYVLELLYLQLILNNLYEYRQYRFGWNYTGQCLS